MSIEESAKEAPSTCLYVGFDAILRCKSFKIRVKIFIELLKIYEIMVLTSFLDFFQTSSMGIRLILHLNFVHIKPQQPNCFDSCTDTDLRRMAMVMLRF